MTKRQDLIGEQITRIRSMIWKVYDALSADVHTIEDWKGTTAEWVDLLYGTDYERMYGDDDEAATLFRSLPEKDQKKLIRETIQ